MKFCVNRAIFFSFSFQTKLFLRPACLCECLRVCCPSLCPGVDMKDDVELWRIFFQWAHPNMDPGLIHRALSLGRGRTVVSRRACKWRRAWRDCTCHVFLATLMSCSETFWRLNFTFHFSVLVQFYSGNKSRKKPVCHQWFSYCRKSWYYLLSNNSDIELQRCPAISSVQPGKALLSSLKAAFTTTKPRGEPYCNLWEALI